MKFEFVETSNAGKSMQEILALIEGIVAPSLETLEKAIQSRKITGGLAAGSREGFFMMDVSSHEEIAGFLRSLPFWYAMKCTVVPLQSPRSAIEQDRAIIQKARATLGGKS